MKKAITITVLLFALVAVGCQRVQHSELKSQVVGIEQVVANPQAYAHKLVTIHGCFIASFERVALLPCEHADADHSIWVEDAEMLHAMEETRLPSIPQAIPDELRTQPKATFIFQYNEAAIRAAWKKLLPANAPNPYRAEVTVVGQFETVGQRPDMSKEGFGHLNMYPHELILLDVRESVPAKVSPSSVPPTGEPVGGGDVAYSLKGFIGYTNTGTPVSETMVECFAPSGKKLATTKTDAEGIFSFPGLQEGRYELKARKPGMYTLTTTVNSTRRSSNFLSLVAEAN